MINGIGGLSMRAIGVLTVSVKIGDKEWPIDMVVQPGDEIVGCLLGFDFFAKYGSSLSMKDGSFEIEGVRFKLGDENKHDMYARVRVEQCRDTPQNGNCYFRSSRRQNTPVPRRTLLSRTRLLCQRT
jgi:hypothetical protein